MTDETEIIETHPPFKLPFYAKLSLIFVGAYVFVYMLYAGRAIILPLMYAMVIATILTPVVNYLERKKVKRIIAITLAVLLFLAFAAALMYVIMRQMSMLANTLPQMKLKMDQSLNDLASWASVHFKIDPEKTNEWIINAKSDLASNGNGMIGQTLLTITGLLEILILIPIYVFMILYYQPLLFEFLGKVFARVHKNKVEDVLFLTKRIIQNYLSGLLIEAVIVGSLNTIALLIIGIDYAILLGITGAILNVIPFIGGILSVTVPVVIALVTKESHSYIFLILMAYAGIQLFDNHYITPKIVASKVKVNALMAVIMVLVGGAIWGIPGMFLSIPLTAIVKVICEHIDQLKPWAILLGDTMHPSARMFFNFPKKKEKVVEKKE